MDLSLILSSNFLYKKRMSLRIRDSTSLTPSRSLSLSLPPLPPSTPSFFKRIIAFPPSIYHSIHFSGSRSPPPLPSPTLLPTIPGLEPSPLHLAQQSCLIRTQGIQGIDTLFIPIVSTPPIPIPSFPSPSFFISTIFPLPTHASLWGLKSPPF